MYFSPVITTKTTHDARAALRVVKSLPKMSSEKSIILEKHKPSGFTLHCIGSFFFNWDDFLGSRCVPTANAVVAILSIANKGFIL